MKSRFHVSLRSGEKIYVNGAVIRTDRKVSIEFLNDVTFLLESHVMRAEQTTTPLRQHYFVVQMMLIDPASIGAAMALFCRSQDRLMASAHDERIVDGLRAVAALVAQRSYFEALKSIRTLIPIEDGILCAEPVINQQREVA